MTENRKNRIWYKIWKVLLNFCLYLYLITFILFLFGQLSTDIHDWYVIFGYLSILSFPILLISFVALFIMKQNDEERKRIEEHRKLR